MKPHFANDGQYDTVWTKCTRTKDEVYPTWMVDLGSVYRIGYMNITQRDGKCRQISIMSRTEPQKS